MFIFKKFGALPSGVTSPHEIMKNTSTVFQKFHSSTMLKRKDFAHLTSKVAKQWKLQSNSNLTNLRNHVASTGAYLEIV